MQAQIRENLCEHRDVGPRLVQTEPKNPGIGQDSIFILQTLSMQCFKKLFKCFEHGGVILKICVAQKITSPLHGGDQVVYGV